jgi:protein-tyrosine phosphatase
MAINVLFVCLGNICRSPTAHGVFQQLVENKKLQDQILVDSAGTSGWHIDCEPDARSCSVALDFGYDLSSLRSRKVSSEDFISFDYILAMDQSNLESLNAIRPSEFGGELSLLMDFVDGHEFEDIPDPYYGGGDSFKNVVVMIEQACEQLLNHIVKVHHL